MRTSGAMEHAACAAGRTTSCADPMASHCHSPRRASWTDCGCPVPGEPGVLSRVQEVVEAPLEPGDLGGVEPVGGGGLDEQGTSQVVFGPEVTQQA